MGVIERGVERNWCNRLLWKGIGVLDCGVERNVCNRMWCETE
jgi:hypothetical protein